MNKQLNLIHKITLIATVLFLLIPLISTILYSLTNAWTTTLLPESYTLIHYQHLFSDQRFWQSLWRSLVVSAVSLSLSLLCIVPISFVIYLRYPRLKSVMDSLILLPFAVPPVVASVGLLSIWAESPIPILGTPYILWGSYFVICLPFTYRAVANNLEHLPLQDLIDAAQLLGANTATAFWHIVLPCLKKGVLIGACLSFSMLLGEFVFANLLVGSRYETLQIYLNQMRMKNSHIASAIVLTYFAITLVFTLLALRISHRRIYE